MKQQALTGVSLSQQNVSSKQNWVLFITPVSLGVKGCLAVNILAQYAFTNRLFDSLIEYYLLSYSLTQNR